MCGFGSCDRIAGLLILLYTCSEAEKQSYKQGLSLVLSREHCYIVSDYLTTFNNIYHK